MDKKKVVLYLGGGAMAGVFGAGIVTKLQDANAYDKIKAVYGSSAGVFNMAYFLSKQTRLGSRIYYEDLTNGFIFVSNGLLGIFQRFWNNYVYKLPRKKILDATDIDFLMDVSKNKKVLDINEIKKNPVEGFAELFNIRKKRVVYMSIKGETFMVIKEGVSVIPYYYPPKRQKFVDGGVVIGKVGYDFLRKKYPRDKLVICINFRPEEVNFKTIIRNFIEGVVASFMYPKTRMVSRFTRKTPEFKKDKKVLLIYPPKNNPSSQGTIDVTKLKKTWQMGQEAAKEVLKWVG